MPKMPSPFADYLTVSETAKLLGYNAQSVRRLARLGKLQAYRFGKEWAFPRPAVVAFQASVASQGKHNPRRELVPS